MIEVSEIFVITFFIFSLERKWGHLLPDWSSLSETLGFLAVTFLSWMIADLIHSDPYSRVLGASVGLFIFRAIKKSS